MTKNKYTFLPQKKFLASFSHYLSYAPAYYFTISHLAHFYFLASYLKNSNVPITILSPENAAAYMGTRWWITLTNKGISILNQPIDHILDCNNNAGLAMAALRLGQKKIFFADQSKQFKLIQSRAESVQAIIISQKPDSFNLIDLKFNSTF